MKIALLYLALMIISNPSIDSQTTEYSGGKMYMVMYDIESNSVLTELPIGEVLSIKYDEFYKSYSIVYNYQKEGVTVMDFKYILTTSEGHIIVKESDSLKDTFFVKDEIETSGILEFEGIKKHDSDEGAFKLNIKIVNIEHS